MSDRFRRLHLKSVHREGDDSSERADVLAMLVCGTLVHSPAAAWYSDQNLRGSL